MSVITGEKITLECDAIGTPPIEFTWTLQGKSLAEVKTVKVKKESTIINFICIIQKR